MIAALCILYVFALFSAPGLAACMISKRVRKRHLGSLRESLLTGLLSLISGVMYGLLCLLIEVELVSLGGKLSPRGPHGTWLIVFAAVYGGGLGFAMPFLNVLYKRSRQGNGDGR